MIKVWKAQVKEQEDDRKAAYEHALANQKQREQALMDAHVLGTNLKDKLYKISMEAPDAWRDLKRFEYQELEDEVRKRREEEEKMQEERENGKGEEHDDDDLKDLEADMKYDAAKAATKSILRKDKSAILSQQEEAAKKIGKTARVKFELGKGQPKEGDSLVDEYLDLMNKQSRLENK